MPNPHYSLCFGISKCLIRKSISSLVRILNSHFDFLLGLISSPLLSLEALLIVVRLCLSIHIFRIHTWQLDLSDSLNVGHKNVVFSASSSCIILLFSTPLNGIECSTSRPSRFIPGKELRHPLNMRLCDPQSRSGCFIEEKTVLSLPGLEPRAVHPVA